MSEESEMELDSLERASTTKMISYSLGYIVTNRIGDGIA